MRSAHRTEITLVTVIGALCLVLAVRAPDFFSSGNLVDILLAMLPALITAVGATLVILTGDIDISVGSIFAVASVVSGILATSGLPMSVVMIGTILVGGALGAFNGALVATLRLPSIVVTLATMVAWRDALRWSTQGAWVQGLPPEFQWLGVGAAYYPWLAVGVAALVLTASARALRMVRGGRAIYAVGSNAEAARLAGIHVAGVRFAVFTAAGVCTALAALLNAVRFNQIPSNAGIGLEMQVIAAVVVGGTSITGGRGTVPGTLLGSVLLGMIGPSLTFLGVSPYWERALQGGIILTAVTLGALRASRAASRGQSRHALA